MAWFIRLSAWYLSWMVKKKEVILCKMSQLTKRAYRHKINKTTQVTMSAGVNAVHSDLSVIYMLMSSWLTNERPITAVTKLWKRHTRLASATTNLLPTLECVRVAEIFKDPKSVWPVSESKLWCTPLKLPWRLQMDIQALYTDYTWVDL